ncbi:uncharacterized protein LOC144444806 isoform X2 [Glandiceps talaboti]
MMYGKDVRLYSYCTVTAVVVLDACARQTRFLITPECRDPNVDHWDELQELENITKPKGSIFVIVYGDDSSRNLSDTKLVADKWLSIWRYNDEKAFMLATKRRCFTIWETFNSAQEQEFQKYLQVIPILPVDDGKVNVLVLGDKERKVYDGYLQRHPFLYANQESGGRHENEQKQRETYTYLSFETKPRATKSEEPATLNVYYSEDFDVETMCAEVNGDKTPLLDKWFPKDTNIHNVVILHNCKKCFSVIGKQEADMNKNYDVMFGIGEEDTLDGEIQTQMIKELSKRQKGTSHEKERLGCLGHLKANPQITGLYLLYSCFRFKAWKERISDQCCNQNIVVVSQDETLRIKFEHMVQNAVDFKQLSCDNFSTTKNTECKVYKIQAKNGGVDLIFLKYTNEDGDLDVLRNNIIKAGLLPGTWRWSKDRRIHCIVCLVLRSCANQKDAFIESLIEATKQTKECLPPMFLVTMSTQAIERGKQLDVEGTPIHPLYFEELNSDPKRDEQRYLADLYKILSSSREYHHACC